MTRPALVLRPEPGNAATARRLEAAGLTVARLPLFGTVAIEWTPPDDPYDALLLTSANAARLAGAGLAVLRHLPVIAVGAGTAAAAEDAGLRIAAVGQGDGAQALSLAHRNGWHRILRLAARDRIFLPGVEDIPVYASEPRIPAPGTMRLAKSTVTLLHSPRAATLFRRLLERDQTSLASVRIAAISDAVAQAAGKGWDGSLIAAEPNDAALVQAACTLAIDH